jgi:hypothetical protein
MLKALSLMQHGPITIEVLAMSAGVQKSQIVHLVKMLEQQGCVTRVSLLEIGGASPAATDFHEGAPASRSARAPLFQRLVHAIRKERGWQDTVDPEEEVRGPDTVPLDPSAIAPKKP